MRSLSLTVLLVVALGASGCFGPAAGVLDADDRKEVGVSGPLYFETRIEAQNLSKDSYWLIHLTGFEEHEVKQGPGDDRVVQCSTQRLYELNTTEKVLEYNPRMADLESRDFRALIIIDYQGVGFGSRSLSTGCPSEYRIEALATRGAVTAHFDHFDRPVTVQAYPSNGALGVQEQYVLPLGHGVGFEYTKIGSTDASEYWVFGEWHVQNLGAWPLENVKPTLG